MGDAKNFLVLIAAAAIGTLLATWAANNVRAVRRAVGSL